MRTVATVLSGLAFLAALAWTIYLLTAPLYHTASTVHTANGEQTVQGTATLVEANGSRVIVQLILVTLVAGLPLLVALIRSPAQRLVTWICALLLLAYSIAGSFTIGLAFLPSALLLLLAGIATLFVRRRSPG
jgi:hypothetical protein